MSKRDQDLSDAAQMNSKNMEQNSHIEQAPVNIQDKKWIIVACTVIGSIFCLLTVLGGLCWLDSLLNGRGIIEKIIVEDGDDVKEVAETTASIDKDDDNEDKAYLEQKREDVDTYTKENKFDEELYDSEEQGFSNQDESDNFSYKLNANIDYLQAYSSIVEEIWHSYGEYCEYTLFDLDQDGIKELITSQGTCDADWTNDVYTIEDGYVSMIGQFYGPVMLYVAEDGDGLYAVYGHMGVQNIDQITKNGGQLQVDTIMNGDIGEDDYYSNDNPVNFITVTDDSLMYATAVDTEQEEGKILLNDLYIDTIFASSELTDNTNIYRAKALLDGKKETCWAEGVDGDGEGEYVEIYFLNPVYLTDISLLNGYMKNEDVFNNNGKIKKIELGYFDGSSHLFNLKEYTYHDIEGQTYSDWISYDTPIYTEYLRITIREAVSGEKYEDTCLSELGLWGYVDSN